VLLCRGFRNSGDELLGSQAALTSGLRDKSDFPLGGQDSNPVHAPPPDFGPDARLDSGVECRSLEAAGKASGGLEPRKSRKVSLPRSLFLSSIEQTVPPSKLLKPAKPRMIAATPPNNPGVDALVCDALAGPACCASRARITLRPRRTIGSAVSAAAESASASAFCARPARSTRPT
jgi:hypothetical protein